MENKGSRKVKLTATIVKERLTIARIPVANPKGQIVDFAPNPDEKRYIVFDTDSDAPRGFGVAVNRGGASYILQRRVGDRVLKATIGNVRDIALKDARTKAMSVLAEMQDSGRSPAQNRELSEDDIRVADMTVAECFALYRAGLVNRAQPAKDSSLRGLDHAAGRLARPEIGLAHRKVGELITEKKILEAFDALAAGKRQLRAGTKIANKQSDAYSKPTKTTAELTFRWTSRAVDYCMEREHRVARNQKREVSLHGNPFHVLREERKYRTKEQLEESYEASSVRNPMQLRDGSLGRFLDALWQRRKVDNYRTACDYLLLTLLWGTRRGEAAPLHWRQKLTREKSLTTSWVDLEERKVHFHDTKNRTSLELPLAPAATRILTQRVEEQGGKGADWVFPARSSKALQGHYLDSKAILQGLKKTAGIEELRTHDLRRTFSTVAEEMVSYMVLKRMLNHRSLRDVTERYPQVAWDRLTEEMARVERAILMTAPIVATALLPVPVTE